MRLPKLYERDSTISREADTTSKRERGNEQMNCNLCGCEGAYIAHKIGRKLISICNNCWYYETKLERKGI